MLNIPIYNVIMTDNEELGINAISLVDEPAVKVNFLKFNKDKIKLNFKIENEEKRLVTGVVLRADFPIYRIRDNGYRYYIVFDKETIIKMTEKMLRDNTFNKINLEHNQNRFVEGVIMRELFIKDTEKGISPKGFEDITNGSLFATYHVTNDEVWQQIKKGEFNGFSIEGNIGIIEKEEPKEIDTIEKLLDYINNYK